MLRIEPIKSYKLPRYQKGPYYERLNTRPWKIAGSIASSVSMLSLLVSSCKPELPPAGLTGPPPMPPNMVTEKEARSVINEVFARNGINLEADVPFSFGDQNPISLDLDGFNKDIHIGYEYITGEDVLSFTGEVRAELDKASTSNSSGPYIKTIDPLYDQYDYVDRVENIIQDFIADLRSRGII